MNPPPGESLESWKLRNTNGITAPATEACRWHAHSSIVGIHCLATGSPTQISLTKFKTLYLPVEIWRWIFYQVIDESEEVAQIDQLDMEQLGPAPFEGFRPDISKAVRACNLALVCHLWRDLSEEVHYRHLHVSDIDSIQRLKVLVANSAFNRIQTPSSLDSRHRHRGSWTYSLTVTASTVPSSLHSAHGFHLTKALIYLLSWLPNIRLFVSSLTFAPSKHLLNNLPKSVNYVSFGPGGSNSLRLLPRLVCNRISMLQTTTSGDMQGNPIQLTNLVCLSISPRTCVVTDWDVPNLSFLSLTLSTGDETALSDTIMEKLGTNLRRVELRNIGNRQIGMSDGFLRWCPQLETLLFDYFGFTFLDDATPRGSRSFSSIKTIVLVIKDYAQFRQAGDRPSFVELQIRVNNLSDLIARSLPNLAHIFMSFSRMTLLNSADIRKEMECEFRAHINVPFSVVFF